MDGRVQLPVIEWLKAEYGLTYVDVITEPGPTKPFCQGDPGPVEGYKNKVQISVERHGSAVIALVAHGDCAGNPLPKDESIRQVQDGMQVIRAWAFPATIVGLWVDDRDWHVERVAVMTSGHA